MNYTGYTEIVDRLNALDDYDAASRLFDLIAQLIQHLGISEYDRRLSLYVRNDYRKRFSVKVGNTLVLALSNANDSLEFQFLISRDFFEHHRNNLPISDVFGEKKKDPHFLVTGIDAHFFLKQTQTELYTEWLKAAKSKLPALSQSVHPDGKNYPLMWDMAVHNETRMQVLKQAYQNIILSSMPQKLYDYIPFFNELNQAIKAIGINKPERQKKLLEKSIHIFGNDHSIAKYGSIDPLSFIYAFAQRNTRNQWRQTFMRAKEAFELNAEIPTDLYFPTPTPHSLSLFYTDDTTYRNKVTNEVVQSDTIWDFHSMLLDDSPDIENIFWEILNLKNVGPAKLTQCMFLINPGKYLPFDNATKLPVSITTDKAIREEGWTEYNKYLTTIADYFPGCAFYEINLFGYLLNQGTLIPNDKFFQISSKIEGGGGRDAFEDFVSENAVYPGDGQSSNGKIVYPLKQPKRGDFVLVRRGLRKLGGIAMVLENEFSEAGYEEGRKINVLWLAKSERNLNYGLGDWAGFNNATDKTWNSFEEQYPETFEVIHKLIAKDSKEIRKTVSKDIALNTILYGPPGTGKTFNTIDKAVEIVTGNSSTHDDNKQVFDELKDEGQIAFVTFHPNYTYEDFIIGIKPNTHNESGHLSFKDHKGIFYKLAHAARQAYEAAEEKDAAARYVLIIDEINRANIARVFGELITLLEDDKRIGRQNAMVITLSNGEDFSLTPNLYILGTMNTADKSIALIDIALRRRFEFIAMYPNYSILQDVRPESVVFLKQLNANIFQKKKTADFLIGHAYLLKQELLTNIILNRIVPLLMEYMSGRIDDVKSLFENTGFDISYDTDSYQWTVLNTPIVQIDIQDATPSLS